MSVLIWTLLAPIFVCTGCRRSESLTHTAWSVNNTITSNTVAAVVVPGMSVEDLITAFGAPARRWTAHGVDYSAFRLSADRIGPTLDPAMIEFTVVSSNGVVWSWEPSGWIVVYN